MFSQKLFASTMFTGFCEFLSKGASWLRLFLLSFLVPIDYFGEVTIIIGLIVLFSGLISFPVNMELITEHHSNYIPFVQAVVIFLLMLPMYYGLTLYRTLEFKDILNILLSSFFLSMNQVMYYFLRVHNIRILNITKIVSSLMGLILFLSLVPISRSFIFLPFFASFLVTLVPVSIFKPVSPYYGLRSCIKKSVVAGWCIFGAQALAQGFSQNGLRVIIGEYLSIEAVGIFTKTYLIASCVFFIFSAVMIKYESTLAKKADSAGFLLKFRPAFSIAILLTIFVAIFAVILIHLSLYFSNNYYVNLLFWNTDKFLLKLLFIYLGLSSVRHAVFPLLLSRGKRGATTWAVIVSVTAQLGFILMVGAMSKLSIIYCGWSFIIAEGVAVVYMSTVLFLEYSKAKNKLRLGLFT
ncbi:hypothetical protein N9X16_00040 [Planktomarina temperata]|nr:hypothetical protein [Planktomarina temperata]